MRKPIGVLCVFLGVVCILSSIGFIAYNQWENKNAERISQSFLERGQNLIDENLSLINKRKKELEEQNNDFLSKEIMRLKNEKSTSVAKEKALAKKTFLERRLALFDALFKKIESKLYEYSKTEEYLKKLSKDLKTAAEHHIRCQ